MNLKGMNQVELDQKIKSLAQQERDLLHEVLMTIKEIDSRRVYFDLGFGSLFDYLVQGVGYSEGSAQRRIDAARLVREIPEVAEKIQSGELKLNQISLVQKAAREIYKSQAKKVTPLEKLAIINNLGNKNHSQSQQQVAAFFDLPVLQGVQKTVQADESVRIEMSLSKDAHTKIQKAQDLLSHAVPTKDLGAFLEYLAEKVIKQKTRAIANSDKSTAQITATVAVTNLKLASVPNSARAPAPADIKHLRATQYYCQYTDPKTGRRCRSSWKLQVDHKHSRWAGGSHQLDNLQLLCAGHNKHKYHREAGIRTLS